MAHNAVALKKSGVLEISKNDDRSYDFSVLPNGMRCLMISDPKTDHSAAAVSVEVGSFHDPQELPGLAHFLEHMLFLGSERFPGENEYSEFLAEHGGMSNAYTAAEETNYHFQVQPSALRGALERFAGFFTSPLFNESATSRELKAVDAEHSKNLQNDMWRVYQLDKSTSKVGHPYNKFGTGDSRTLRDIPASKGIDVRKALLDFHAEHYSAGRMHLVILGKEPLSTLSEWARELFVPVKNNGSKMPVVEGHPHEGRTATVFRIVPIKEERSMSITWALPEVKTRYARKPTSYLSHLLGHEGPGSLCEYLRKCGWVTELSAGTSESNAAFSTFHVYVDLTEEGAARIDDVQAAVYAYIGMLQAAGPQAWIWEENACQAAASYRYLNKSRPFNYVVMCARNMAIYPAEHIVSGGSLYRHYAPEEITAMLAYCRPDNSRVGLMDPRFASLGDALLSEQWYGTQYTESPLTAQQLARFNAAANAYKALAGKRGPEKTAAQVLAPGSDVGAGGGGASAGVEQLDGEATSEAWAAGLTPALCLPAPNEFLATDFVLRHPDLRKKQLETEGEGAASPLTTSCGCGAAGADHDHAATATAVGGAGGAASGGSSATASADPFADVKPRRAISPMLLADDARTTLWWHLDDHFAVPKAYVLADIQLPAAYASPTAIVLQDIYNRIAQQSLTDFAYAASLAELQYSSSATVLGMRLEVGGFSEKAGLMLRRIVERMLTLPITDAEFAIQKDKAERAYRDFDKEQPLQHTVYNTSLSLNAPRWHNDDKVKVIAGLTADHLRAYQRDHLWSQAHTTMLVSGSVTQEEARAIAEGVTGQLAAVSREMTRSQHIISRATRLPTPLHVSTGSGGSSTAIQWDWVYTLPARNPEEPNCAMSYCLQVGHNAWGPAAGISARFSLLAHLLSEPYFDQLRTKQALGYIVNAGSTRESGINYIRFIVQSNKVPAAADLVARTDAFLSGYVTTLAEMEEAKFAAHVRAVINSVNTQDKNLYEEAKGAWGAIAGDGTLDFQWASHVTAALTTITKADVQAFLRDYVLPGGRLRRAFICLMEASPTAGRGSGAGEEEEEEAPAIASTAAAATSAAATATADAEADPTKTASTPPAQPTPVAGGDAATGGGGKATEDAIAPVVASPSTSSAPSTPAIPASVVVRMSSEQATSILANLRLLEFMGVNADGGHVPAEAYPSVLAAFKDAGVDLGAALEARPAVISCSVAVSHYEDVRAVLPRFESHGAARMTALRAGLMPALKTVAGGAAAVGGGAASPSQ